MVTTTLDTGREASTASQGRRLAAWSGIAGAVVVGAAAYLVLSLSPEGSGADATQRISDFYLGDGNSGGLLVAEPLSIVGGFLLLWFFGNLTGTLRGSKVDSGRYTSAALAGGVTFVVLAFASITAQTTVAGSTSFYPAFEVDPHAALMFSHLGYILLAGAMAAAAVLLAATGVQLRRGAVGPRWLGTVAYVLVPISLLSMFFVYLPLLLFLIWVLLVSMSRLRTDQIPG